MIRKLKRKINNWFTPTFYDWNIGLKKHIAVKKDLIAARFRCKPSSERRFHVYCIGLPRSGTHTIAELFSKEFQSAHEPAHKSAAIHLLKSVNREYSEKTVKRLIKYRDCKLNLEMEAAHYLIFWVDYLVHLFPEARFIITVREPLTWIESEINQNMMTTKNPTYNMLEAHRYSMRSLNTHQTLNKPERFSYKSYVEYYRKHISLAMETIPEDRRLFVNTFRLSGMIPEIANFCYVEANQLDLAKIKSGQRKEKLFSLQELSRNELTGLVNMIDDTLGSILKAMPESVYMDYLNSKKQALQNAPND